MKGKLSLLVLALLAALLVGCQNQTPDVSEGKNVAAVQTETPIEVDLTRMSSTVVYSYIFNIVNTPEEYVGQRFRMSGICDESYWDETNTTYHYIVISDATACCAQGLEFVLTDDALSYPEKGTNIEICGVFESYDELGTTYYHIAADSIK